MAASRCTSSSRATSSRRSNAVAWRRRHALRARLLACVFVLGLGGCSLIWRPTNRYIEYTVQRGDTVWAVAQRFRVDPDEVLYINRISDPRALQIGQTLYLPYVGQQLPSRTASAQPAVAPPQANTAQVQTVSVTNARQFIGGLLWPVQGGKVSSSFGRRWLSFHEGIDLPGAIGTSILAAHDGVVAYSGDTIRGYGNMIVLKADGLVTVYAHNQRNLVRVGERVRRGTRIALLGNTGKSTGPHLHFETRVVNAQGKLMAVDPMVFFPGR